MGKVGRPKSENPRDMVLPETRMTKGEMRMAKIKAALYAGGSMARLVRDAIAAYKGEMADKKLETCPLCDKGKLFDVVYEREYTFQIGNAEHCIKVSGIPAQECSKCKDMPLDLILLSAIEEILQDAVENALRKGVSLPERVRFEDLLKQEPIPFDEKGLVLV